MSDPAYFVRPPQASEIPLIVCVSHSGTEVPAEIRSRFASAEIAALPDTDWHLHELWDFVPRLGATLMHARYHRYVVDLNRPRETAPLYAGRFETTVVPTRTLDDEPIYRTDARITAAEIVGRLQHFWQPFHDRLATELARKQMLFGYVLLLDAHSIRSLVPRIHKGRLPGLMLGDFDGRSAAPEVSEAVLEVIERSGISFRANDPFKGGFITRHYGQPGHGVHALQLEMCQRLYMDEAPPRALRSELAAKVRPVLQAVLHALVDAAALVV